MIRKIFLWIGLSYSFMSNAQLVLKSGVTASSTTNSNSIYTNGKFKIGGLTNGTAPTTDPTASLEVNGDATFNLSSAQTFKINLSGAPNNKLQFDNTDLGFRLNSYTSASTANWCYIGSSFNYTSVAASVVRSLSFTDINSSSWGITSNHPSFRINNYNASGTLGFSTGGTDRLTINPSGYVGIGISPSNKLHVNVLGEGAGCRFDVSDENMPVGGTPNRIYLGLANKASLSFVAFNDTRMHIHQTTTENGLQISGGNGDAPASSPLVTFRSNGQVFIGNKIPVSNSYNDANAKLIVDGKIMAKEIVSNFNEGEWRSFPDYVFEKDYKLMPLDSLRGYITANKHLPEIPSAKEVEEKGLHLSALAVQQMKKIEELTLYLLEQQKQMQTQQQQISELQKEVAGLKSKE